MDQYNFDGLSGFEFEHVVRDLLQEAHGVQYQTSPPGPDGGVDLRYISPTRAQTVVQCKQYGGSSVSTLLSQLRRHEVEKVRALAPSRYILVTSLRLSLAVKDEIALLFAPFCHSSHDIIAAHDLENLIGQFPNVADRHIKLWLTSEPVLRRVLQAGIFDDSERELELIRRRLALYITTESLGRARRMLEDQHVCVITGLPGIGKTTLARMLLIEYESLGYNVVRIPNHLSQVLGAARRGAKVVYYFDDFLGQTVLDRWERNEDQRLVEFMETVRHEGHWRFILTTREYILEEARLRSEALSRLQIHARTCTIQLNTDYTLDIRAQILYQHLYFSSLAPTFTLALLQSNTISKILSHRNYSPRLVDLLTSRSHTSAVSADEYVSEFLETLENPERLWGVAFRAMNSAAQDLALTMASMPSEITLDHLRRAYEAFRKQRVRRLNQPRRADEFEESLRILDGTMMRTYAPNGNRHRQILVSFHNPSVRDFLQSRLRDHSTDVDDLVASAVFIDQYITLFQSNAGMPLPQVTRAPNEFVAGVSRVIEGEAAHRPSVLDTMQLEGGRIGTHSQSPESKALFAFDIARCLQTPEAEQLRAQQFERLFEYATAGVDLTISHTAAFLRHVYMMHRRDPVLDAELIDVLLTSLIASVEWETDLSALMDLLDAAPSLFQAKHIEEAKRAVVQCGNNIINSTFFPASKALYVDAAEVLSHASGRLGVDVEDLLAALEARACQIQEDEQSEPARKESERQEWQAGIDIHALFQRLERELGSRGGTD